MNRKSRENKLMLISLFEQALLRGTAALHTKKDRLVVIHESSLNKYPRLLNITQEKIIRKVPIREEDCFLLLYSHKERIKTIKPGFLFYSNGSIFLEENWIEENCYWESCVIDIIQSVIDNDEVKIVDSSQYLD